MCSDVGATRRDCRVRTAGDTVSKPSPRHRGGGHRPALDGPFVPREPVALMAEAIAAALGDLPAGVDPGAVAAAVDHLACVDPLAWGYTELCEITASHAGLPAGTTCTLNPCCRSRRMMLYFMPKS